MNWNRSSEAARPGAASSLRARAGLVLGAATLLAVATGCGMEKKRASEEPVAASVVVPAPARNPSVHASAASYMLETQRRNAPAVAAEGFPPDIVVTVSDTVASPGEVIEIAVEATPDVTEMSLWDGLGDRQALHYDEAAKAWRVSYRVPLRLPWERTGLSITAKNESNRWCRSWVFVRTRTASLEPADPVRSDSVSPESALAIEK